jgi:hypothetical protein
MSGDYHSIQQAGGAELTEHYPDRGLISESNWFLILSAFIPGRE